MTRKKAARLPWVLGYGDMGYGDMDYGLRITGLRDYGDMPVFTDYRISAMLRR
jgi:hypothetical protein